MPEERYEVPRDTYNQRMYGGRRAGKTYAETQAYWDQMELNEMMAPLSALEHTIYQGTLLRPSGIMVPLGLGHHFSTVMGHEIILGDRTALLYEPPR